MITTRVVSPDDLVAFHGAPFSQDLIDSAVASVRSDAGWHIAPVVSETMSLVADGFRERTSYGEGTWQGYRGRDLIVPSGRIVSVDAVVANGITYTDFILGPGGVLRRWGGWPSGLIAVTVTHGYDLLPADLLPVVAARAFGYTTNQALVSQRLIKGPFVDQMMFRDLPGTLDRTVAKYALMVVA